MSKRGDKVSNKSYIITVFRSRQHALNFADILKQNGIKVAIMPTPKELSLGCGSSVKLENGFWQEARIILQNKEVEHDGVYSVRETRNGIDFERLI